MIHTSLSPNSLPKDIAVALSYLFLPWKWPKVKDGKYVRALEQKFEKYLGVNHAFAFDSGRSALYAAIKALGIGEGDEVLLQAFTCVVVPNAIIFNKAKPVYIDIDRETLNIDPVDLESKITPKSKAVIIQNTFGKPADYDALLKIAKKHNLKVIEDCAHCLGGEYKGKKLGTIGDIAMFSFNRDKVISTVYGGMAVTNDPDLFGRLKNIQEKLQSSPNKKIAQHLRHPLIFAVAVPLYNFLKLGRAIIVLAQKLKLISKVIELCEKKCQKPKDQPAKLANALAQIGLNQLDKLESFNKHRTEIARFYRKELRGTLYQLPPLDEKGNKNVYLRFVIQTKRRDQIFKCAKKAGIFLGDWYDEVVAPKDVDLDCTQYEKGSCPNAEKAAKMVLNLPTHHKISMRKAKKIVNFLREF